MPYCAQVESWGFTRQKPSKRAYEQSPAAVQALIKDAGKKVFLILDNLGVHHSKLLGLVWKRLRQALRQPSCVAMLGKRRAGKIDSNKVAVELTHPSNPGAIQFL